MTPEREERIEGKMDDMLSGMGELRGLYTSLSNAFTVIHDRVVKLEIQAGIRDHDGLDSSNPPPMRRREDSSVSLHAPAGIGIAFRGPVAITIFVALLVLSLGAAGGYFVHASAHAVTAAQGAAK